MAEVKANLTPVITVDGKQYVPMTRQLYDELCVELEESRKARYLGVEEFRLWCKANKGTETVEEGLRACTEEELYKATLKVSTTSYTWMVMRVANRLKERRAQAEEARQRITRGTVMPGKG